MNKKLVAFRAIVLLFIITAFTVSYKLESEAECLIMFFTFLFSLGYLGAEVMIARDEAKSNS
jgi:hypothetical protein